MQTWNSAWDTGNPSIDEQHHRLLEQMERLILALAEGREKPETERTLLLLGDYIEEHFRDEEALMERTGYPGLAQHRSLHDGLRAQVTDLFRTYQADPRAIPLGVMDFLVAWLKDHLASEDRLLAAHLQAPSAD